MLLMRRLVSAGCHILAQGHLIRAWTSTSPLVSTPFRSYRTTMFTSYNSENEPESIPATKLKTHTITWLMTDEVSAKNKNTTSLMLSFDAYDGETLRTAALRRNVASPHNGRTNLINCRGLGTCGTCAVEIVTGQVEPSERNPIEQLRFRFPPHNLHNNTQLRLACQIQVKGDVQVIKRTGFWGQQEDVAPLSTPKLYGDFEYLLDTKSPDANRVNIESKKKITTT